MAKNKFYVVWQGREPGVYDNWADCQAQIKDTKAARYKSFEDQAHAEKAYREGWEKHLSTKKLSDLGSGGGARPSVGKPVRDSVSVDAACSGNPGLMEYRGVYTGDKTVLFAQGPFPGGTNNIGEFLALVHALALLKKKGRANMIIYTDSVTAMAWVRGKKAKTTLKETAENETLFELIDRAETWLAENVYHNPIVKWETQVWGEIPADYGRK